MQQHFVLSHSSSKWQFLDIKWCIRGIQINILNVEMLTVPSCFSATIFFIEIFLDSTAISYYYSIPRTLYDWHFCIGWCFFRFIHHANFVSFSLNRPVHIAVSIHFLCFGWYSRKYLIALDFRFTISFRFISFRFLLFDVAMSAVIAVFYGFKWH